MCAITKCAQSIAGIGYSQTKLDSYVFSRENIVEYNIIIFEYGSIDSNLEQDILRNLLLLYFLSIEIYDLISIKWRKNREIIKKLGTATYQLKLLNENGSDPLWTHNEFNMLSKLMGSHLA